MRKRSWFVLLVVFLVGMFFFLPSFPVKADSGWDTDYDSGSDWGSSSDSDWGSSSDSDWGSSSYDDHDYGHSKSRGIIEYTMTWEDKVIVIILIIGVFIYVIVKIDMRHSNYNVEDVTRSYNAIKRHHIGDYDEEINKVFPGYDEKKLLEELYQIFVDIQVAWMEFDYDKLEKLCVDELFQSYKADLEVLKLKHGKNIMSDFKFVEGYLNSVKRHDDQYVINISLSVAFHDYVINTDTDKVIRGGTKKLVHNTYSLTYVIDIDKTKEAICPSCGAVVKGKKCSYCNSYVKEPHRHFMLSKKSKS